MRTLFKTLRACFLDAPKSIALISHRLRKLLTRKDTKFSICSGCQMFFAAHTHWCVDKPWLFIAYSLKLSDNEDEVYLHCVLRLFEWNVGQKMPLTAVSLLIPAGRLNAITGELNWSLLTQIMAAGSITSRWSSGIHPKRGEWPSPTLRGLRQLALAKCNSITKSPKRR